jgi:hypothetical protein
MTNAAAFTLPAPVLAASGYTASVGSAAVVLPRFVYSAGSVPNSAAFSLPVPTFSAQGSIGLAGTAAFTLPSPQISSGDSTGIFTLPAPVLAAQGLAGIAGVGVFVMPLPVMAAYGQSAAMFTLPAMVLSAEGITGAVGASNLLLPAPVLVSSGLTAYQGSAAFVMPKPTLIASGTVGNVGQMNIALRQIALAASGATGSLGTAQMILPVMQVNAQGYQNTVGYAQITLPIMLLQATGHTPENTVANTIVMHTENFALTQYEGYNFNSFAKFNNLYLGASSSGIFALAGSTDNGVNIDAVARMGMSDLSTSHLKRIDRCYVGYRADGNLVLRVYTDEINQRDYMLAASGAAGLHGNHTRIGKGLAARYWQFEVRNQNGSYFELNALEVKPTVLRRRIGGGDA